MASTDRILGICDRFVAVTIKIFDSTSFFKQCSPSRRNSVLCLNFALILITWITDSVFLSSWTEFKITPPPAVTIDDIVHGVNTTSTSSIDDDLESIDLITAIELQQVQLAAVQQVDAQVEYRVQLRSAAALGDLFLACYVISTALIPLHLATHAFAVWRESWRQSLVLVIELVTLVSQCCLPPILVCVLFAVARICPSFTDHDHPEYRWRLLIFSVVHSASIIWQAVKLIHIGLCCCCCSGMLAGVWPCYKYVKEHQRRAETGSAGRRHRRPSSSLAGKVLDYMPPESDRGNWLNGMKWCLLTCWTFPGVVVAAASCVLLNAVVILGENFLYNNDGTCADE